jgi:hypothetical protein
MSMNLGRLASLAVALAALQVVSQGGVDNPF